MEKIEMNQKLDLMSFLETEHRKLLRANEVAGILGISLETVYDWKYRSKMRKVPEVCSLRLAECCSLDRIYLRGGLLDRWDNLIFQL